MDILPNNILLRDLGAKELIAYLQLIGWGQAEVPGDRWLLFRGTRDASGKPLEIVLPMDLYASDITSYLASAVNLLAALKEESPEIAVKRIKSHDRDVLSIRNVETGEQASITLKLASEQVQQLKRLVAYAASSEQDPRPHFNVALSVANRMVSHYRFGHTFSGSFGFTMESPIIGSPYVYRQAALLPDTEEVVLLPTERRVMERIVRGLESTKRATMERDLSVLVKGYSGGFNANMCEAIVALSQNKTMPIEYSVLWSPKLSPSEDVGEPSPILLREMSYSYLEEAAKELKELEPEQVTIVGPVRGLSSKGDPLGSKNTARSIVVKWTNRPEGRPVDVIVVLDREDYVTAHDAHLNWTSVQVSGTIERVGNVWRLSQPHDFSVLGSTTSSQKIHHA